MYRLKIKFSVISLFLALVSLVPFARAESCDAMRDKYDKKLLECNKIHRGIMKKVDVKKTGVVIELKDYDACKFEEDALYEAYDLKCHQERIASDKAVEDRFKNYRIACIEKVEEGNEKECRALLQKRPGQKIDDIRDCDGQTLLFAAAFMAKEKAFDFLLAQGASIETYEYNNGLSVFDAAIHKSDLTPKEHAARMRIAKKILSKGYNVNALNHFCVPAISILNDDEFFNEKFAFLFNAGGKPNFDAKVYTSHHPMQLQNKEAMDAQRKDLKKQFMEKLRREHPNLSESEYERILEKNTYLNFSVDMNSAFETAVSSSKIETVKFLLDHGSNINQSFIDKKTPLYVAVEQKNYGMIDLLMSRGANVFLPQDRPVIVYLAKDPNTSDLLIKYGVDLNKKIKIKENGIIFETSVMEHAVKGGNTSFVRYLLEKNIGVDFISIGRDSSGEITEKQNLLAFSIVMGNKEIFDLLLQSKKMNLESDFVSYESGIKKASLFSLALFFGKYDMAASLMAYGADINRKVEVKNGNVFTNYFCAKKDSALSFKLVQNKKYKPDETIMKKNGMVNSVLPDAYLILTGNDKSLKKEFLSKYPQLINARVKVWDEKGKISNSMSPLVLSIVNGNLNDVKYFVEKGANLNLEDTVKVSADKVVSLTPVAYSLFAMKPDRANDKEIFLHLLSKEKNISAKLKDCLRKNSGDVVAQFMLLHQIIKDKDVILALKKKKFDFNIAYKDESNNEVSLLEMAVGEKDKDVVQLLLSCGAKVTQRSLAKAVLLNDEQMEELLKKHKK